LDDLHFTRDAIPVFRTFTDTLQNGVGEFQSICGNGTLPVVVATGDLVSQGLCDIGDVLRSVRVYFNCRNWYPLYQTLTYDTVCFSGTEGFAWVASTSFVIVLMTMIILTLRITFYEVEHVDDNKVVPVQGVVVYPNNVKQQQQKEADHTHSEEEEEEDIDVDPHVVLPTTQKNFQSSTEWPKDVEDSSSSGGELMHPHEPPTEIIYETPIQLSPETPNVILEGTWDDIIPEEED
jgi:hypothetical protein